MNYFIYGSYFLFLKLDFFLKRREKENRDMRCLQKQHNSKPFCTYLIGKLFSPPVFKLFN